MVTFVDLLCVSEILFAQMRKKIYVLLYIQDAKLLH